MPHNLLWISKGMLPIWHIALLAASLFHSYKGLGYHYITEKYHLTMPKKEALLLVPKTINFKEYKRIALHTLLSHTNLQPFTFEDKSCKKGH